MFSVEGFAICDSLIVHSYLWQKWDPQKLDLKELSLSFVTTHEWWHFSLSKHTCTWWPCDWYILTLKMGQPLLVKLWVPPQGSSFRQVGRICIMIPLRKCIMRTKTQGSSLAQISDKVYAGKVDRNDAHCGWPTHHLTQHIAHNHEVMLAALVTSVPVWCSVLEHSAECASLCSSTPCFAYLYIAPCITVITYQPLCNVYCHF